MNIGEKVEIKQAIRAGLVWKICVNMHAWSILRLIAVNGFFFII